MKKVLSSYKDSLIMIAGIVIGSIVGLIWGPGAAALTPVADVFLNLLFCIVVPLVFVSIANSIASLQSGKTMGKLLIWTFVVFTITHLIAALVSGVAIGLLEPAKGAIFPTGTEVVEVEKVNFNFLSQLTVADFNSLWSRRALLALVVFALLTGVALRSIGEKGKPVLVLLQSINEIIFKLVAMIMKLAPIGLGCYFASMIGQYGEAVSGPMMKMTVATWIIAVLYMIVFHTVYSFFGGGASGVKKYWQNMLTPAMTALGTSSSAASLPANIKASKDAGLEPEVTSVVMPLGTNLHKEGACLISVITVSYMYSMLGYNIFEPRAFLQMILIAVLGAMITGAIPSGGNVIIMLIFSAFGFPPAGIPLIIALHTLTDPPTTMLNVVGDLANGIVINHHVKDSLIADREAAEVMVVPAEN